MSSGSKWGYVEAIVGSLSGYSGGTLGIVVEVKASEEKKLVAIKEVPRRQSERIAG